MKKQVVPFQKFDVLVCVTVRNAPYITPEQMALMFDQDMGEMQGFPLSDTKIRTIRAVSKT